MIRSGSLFLICALALSAQASDLKWSEVEESTLVSLQEIRHSSGQEFSVGTKFQFQDLVVGGGFLSFQFRGEKCRNAEIVSDEIDLIIPPGGNERTSVGVQVGKDCLLQVFVETKDLQTQSFFGDGK